MKTITIKEGTKRGFEGFWLSKNSGNPLVFLSFDDADYLASILLAALQDRQHRLDEERMDVIGQNGNDGQHYDYEYNLGEN